MLTIALSRNMLNGVRIVSQENARGIADLQSWTMGRDEADERREVLSWLDTNSINMEHNLKAASKHRQPGTGEWLFELSTFKAWATGKSSILWIHGIRR